MKNIRAIALLIPFCLLCLISQLADTLAEILDHIADLAQRGAQSLEARE